MNILSKLNPTLFKLILAFGFLDCFWGLATLFAPDQAITNTQSHLISTIGKDAFGVVFAIKGATIVALCLTTVRYQVLQKFMIVGLTMWLSLAATSLIGFFTGTYQSIFGLGLFIFMAYFRYLAISFVPPKETVR